MTKEEHTEHHKILHNHLDKILADYICHHPSERNFTEMPIMKLLEWSYEQTKNPTGE